VKQKLRKLHPDIELKVKEEVDKLIKDFLKTLDYSDWISNIVPVPKKDGKVRVCI